MSGERVVASDARASMKTGHLPDIDVSPNRTRRRALDYTRKRQGIRTAPAFRRTKRRRNQYHRDRLRARNQRSLSDATHVADVDPGVVLVSSPIPLSPPR